MKAVGVVFLLALTLTPCFAFTSEALMQSLSLEASSKDSFSKECVTGINKLSSSVEFMNEERKRTCPEKPVDNQWHCGVTESWESSCAAAGGDVCTISVKFTGNYDGEYGKYKMVAPFCVPKTCKKGKNLEVLEDIFDDQVCGSFHWGDCDLDLKCPVSSKAGIIAVGVLLGLTVIGGAAVGGFFIWKRYYAANTPQASTPGAFHEYSELAQYEEEEADIIADSEITEGEETHSIN